jgi:hypothetical protein
VSSEVYISIDIETNGPCPIKHSMLSLGAAAFVANSDSPLDTFSANLETLSGAVEDPATMAWWGKNMEAYQASRLNQEAPLVAMKRFRKWLDTIPIQGKRVAVCFPAGFDFTFVYVYLHTFLGESPLGFSALDIKSFAMHKLAKPYGDCTKRNFPKAWFDSKARHTHVAVDDAIEQGVMFIRMLNS